jgi:type VI protein secretion system component Hcp
MQNSSYFLVLIFSLTLFLNAFSQSVGIGTTLPHESAALHIKSFSKGLLIPSMSTSDRLNINDPAYGLLVFDEFDEILYWRDSTNWVPILASNIGLVDIDKDTRVTVEEQTDEDIIRFFTNTNERMRINQNGIEILNNGESVFIGELAGQQDDLSGNKNVFVGFRAGENNVSGTQNIAIGNQALNFNQGNSNSIAIGQQALQKSIASNNIGIGLFAARDNSNGNKNIAIGNFAGFVNQSGSQNTFLGYEAGRGNTNTAINGSVMIGHQAGMNETRNQTLHIANSATNSPLIYGEFDSSRLRINGRVEVNDPEIDGFQLPAIDGDDGQVLKTDGNGQVAWASDNAGGGSTGNTNVNCTTTYEHYEAIGPSVSNFYLKIPTIDGESVEGNHPDEIICYGYDFNTKPIAPNDCDNFTISLRKSVDIATPKLMEASFFGAILKDIKVFQTAINSQTGAEFDLITIQINDAQIIEIDQEIFFRGNGEFVLYEVVKLKILDGLKYTLKTINNNGGNGPDIEFDSFCN